MKGFTLAEMMVTLALTGLLAMFAYKGLGYVQTMFQDYNKESSFISTVNALQERIEVLTAKQAILIQNNDRFVHLSDTLNEYLKVADDYVLIGHLNKADTFKLKCTGLKVVHSNSVSEFNVWRPVEKVEWTVTFKHQLFIFSLLKEYDGKTLLNYETTKLNNAGN